MVDWDRNGPQLRANLTAILRQARDDFRARSLPTLDTMRTWHVDMMHGLSAENSGFIGAFRGEPGVEFDVHVNGFLGTPFSRVSSELDAFEARLQRGIRYLDGQIGPNEVPSTEQSEQVIQLATWAHFELVRIHPFINGNGRIARLWVNAIAMRYNMPPFLSLRPRPGGEYGTSAAQAMKGGNWHDLVPVFQRLFEAALR